MKRLLITGSAGFIGFHFTQKLLKNKKYHICAVDSLNSYYDVNLKLSRLQKLQESKELQFHKGDIAHDDIFKLFRDFKPDIVVNLAAQAGVRYSLENPRSYADSNLIGFLNILEACRKQNVEHLIYASSSSVYGANRKIPFSETDGVDHPVSLYAATKKSNELMAHSYSHLYGIPTTGLRFFTVYGPYGRPDMAYYKFAKAIKLGMPIEIYNNGNMKRDFTYVDDIIVSMEKLLIKPPQSNSNWDAFKPDPSSSSAPYRIYNIGNNSPEKLMDMIAILEKHMGQDAVKKFLPMQPGDVYETYADTDSLFDYLGFKPSTSLDEGLKLFVDWFNSYQGHSG